MSTDSAPDVQLEIGHVLFMDVVGYSKLLINDQRELQEQLSEIVRGTNCFRSAEAAGRLIRLPVGDGMALVFFHSPEAPVQCAIEISKALKNYPNIQLRMGIQGGPVNQVRDVNDRTNIAGAGINIAQRVMDCADAGHILLSKRVAEDLAQSRQWQPYLRELGEYSVKHGVSVGVFNFYNEEVGNPQMPMKLKQAQEERTAMAAANRAPPMLRRRNVVMGAAVALAGLIALVVYERRPFLSSAGEPIPEKSIAVLPFTNISDNKQNAFFADGIQDDILTSLAKIGALRVISRSSAMQFRDPAAHNLREIGKLLGVTNVLEGSVRREGDRVVYMAAIGLDPKFALAHARLASTRAAIFHYYEPLDAWKTKARVEADIALQLQQNLAEAHLALGQCMYWIDQDYNRALVEFDTASRLSPNNSEAGGLIAAIKRRQGKWQESLDSYQKISKLDPQNPNIARNLVFTQTVLRRWPEAARGAERMRGMAPASLVAKIQSGYIDFWWKEDTKLLKSLADQVPAGTDPDGVITSVRWDVAMLERDFASARQALEKSPLTDISYTNAGATPKSFFVGCVLLATGNNADAEKAFELARPAFEAQVKEAPDSADRHANLGWCYAFMGRKEDAIREGRRAVELKPESADAFDGAIMNCYLALIYARCGEKDLAIPLIERLLKTPGAVDSVVYSIAVNDLKYRWEWDPIRNDPRFQKLVNAKP